MGKIRIVDLAALDAVGEDGAETVFGGPRDPVHARLHHLSGDVGVPLDGGVAGRIAYVWEGAARIGATRLDTGSMVAVEHGGKAMLHAAAGEAKLLVFNRATPPDAPLRAGGHVHVLPAESVPRCDRLIEQGDVGGAILADSGCPTCELWLHETTFHETGFHVIPHFHTEDEVIVVTSGEIMLGRRLFGRGTAISVPRNTIYSFHSGPGLSFINFRPSRPTYGAPGMDGVHEEQAIYARKLGRPPYLEAV